MPTDESSWSPRLRVYFKALNQYHARRRETPLGVLMVTNLSGFPSSLTVIPVPDGDLRKHRSDFFVNENLKRLNCSGRVGMTLVPPTGATTAKFHQLYRTSDKNSIYASVIELVKLCQSALLLFAKLEVDYADGLLCDVTERAINDWWVELGSSYYPTIEPHDGILGPTTVAGLLGLLMGARNRLHSVNAPVNKDPFDVESMKKAISAFQKSQRLPRSRRLDRQTLARLHKASQKAAASEAGWVPKAVKSTVAELSGKGGEMVTDLVHKKDRAGIAEIETCDIERFVQLVYGERAKWLWYGKAVKSKGMKDVVGAAVRVGEEGQDHGGDGFGGKALNFRESVDGGFTWTGRKSVADGLGGGKNMRETDDLRDPDAGAGSAGEGSGEDEGVKGIIKRTSGFKEARSGLGKVKGAVGLSRSHQKKGSKDTVEMPIPQTPPNKLPPKTADSKNFIESPRTPTSPRSPRTSLDDSPKGQQSSTKQPSLQRSHTSPTSSRSGAVAGDQSPKTPAQGQRPSWNVGEAIPELVSDAAPAYAASYREPGARSGWREGYSPPPSYRETGRDASMERERGAHSYAGSDAASESVTIEPSVAGSIYNDVELNEVLPTGPETEKDVSILLRRTNSDSAFVRANLETHPEDAYPRHLSFSLAEDSVLIWPDVVEKGSPESDMWEGAERQIADESFFAKEASKLQRMIQLLASSTATFTQDELRNLQSLLSKLADDEHNLTTSLYQPTVERENGLHTHSETVLRGEKERLEEAGKELETLAAKLEYEINGLKGRVDEVAAGVGDFEKSVGRVEERVNELEKDERKVAEGGWSCSVM